MDNIRPESPAPSGDAYEQSISDLNSILSNYYSGSSTESAANALYKAIHFGIVRNIAVVQKIMTTLPSPAPVAVPRVALNTIVHALRVLQETREPAKDGRGCANAERGVGDTACDHSVDAPILDNLAIDDLCERLNLATREAIAERSWKAAAATSLKDEFPWLGTDEDAGSSGDVIDQLAELYCQWSQEPLPEGPAAASEKTRL